MKHKRKISRSTAILAVQTMPCVATSSQKRENLKTFTENLLAEEQADAQRAEDLRMKPVREQERILSENLRELRAQQADALLRVESAELASRCPILNDADVLDETGKPYAVETIRDIVRDAFAEAKLALLEDEGFRLEQSGVEKVQRIARLNPNLALTQARAWVEIIHLADELGVFNDRDVIRTQSQPERPEQPEPEQKESFDDVLSRNSTESGAGRSRIADAMMSSMQEDVKAWFDAFYRSLESYFHYSLSESEVQSVISVMKSDPRTLWCSAKAWDAARITCVKQGTLPSTLLYPVERFEELLESSDSQSYEGRRELRRQERLLGVPTTTVEY